MTDFYFFRKKSRVYSWLYCLIEIKKIFSLQFNPFELFLLKNKNTIMKKLTATLILFLCFANVFAQRGTFNRDLFGTLKYNSSNQNYSSSLEKNVFDALTFTDSKKNKITFDKKYLAKYHPGVLSDNTIQTNFFKKLIRDYSRESEYIASYEINVFNEEVIKDNKGYSSKKGKDIFGHDYYEENGREGNVSIKRNIQGVLEYKENGFNASLGKNVFNKRIYNDSDGNELQFNETTWNRMIKRFGTDKEILWFLIDNMFYGD